MEVHTMSGFKILKEKEVEEAKVTKEMLKETDP